MCSYNSTKSKAYERKAREQAQRSEDTKSKTYEVVLGISIV